MESEKPPHEPGEIAGPRKQGIMADEHVPDPDEADLDDLDGKEYLHWASKVKVVLINPLQTYLMNFQLRSLTRTRPH